MSPTQFFPSNSSIPMKDTNVQSLLQPQVEAWGLVMDHPDLWVVWWSRGGGGGGADKPTAKNLPYYGRFFTDGTFYILHFTFYRWHICIVSLYVYQQKQQMQSMCKWHVCNVHIILLYAPPVFATIWKCKCMIGTDSLIGHIYSLSNLHIAQCIYAYAYM